jgi:hypothetical protein
VRNKHARATDNTDKSPVAPFDSFVRHPPGHLKAWIGERRSAPWPANSARVVCHTAKIKRRGCGAPVTGGLGRGAPRKTAGGDFRIQEEKAGVIQKSLS